jgi:S23 ribosomal protein.
MYLESAHSRPDVDKAIKELVLYCYKATKSLPAEEKFAMVSQIRKAALSVHLNISERCARAARFTPNPYNPCIPHH